MRAQLLGAVLDEDEEARLIDANTRVVARALPEGDFVYEILSASGDVIACFDLAWPDELQFGLSEPAAQPSNPAWNVHPGLPSAAAPMGVVWRPER